MFFRDIAGHYELKTQLIKQVREARLPHARLFLGPEGCGSLALALAQAQYIQCLDPGPEDSCGRCSACLKNMKYVHPDLHFSFPFAGAGKDDSCDQHAAAWRHALLKSPFMGIEEWQHELQTENKQLNINIKECHEIYRKLSMKPFEAQFQILVLWRPEYMGKEGNSLLKLIEEPSARTLMIFVAEDQEGILPTLLSRMQLQKVRAYTDAEISAWLIEKEETDAGAAEHFAFMAEGNLGHAIALSRGEVTDYRPLFDTWMEVCRNGDISGIYTWVEKMSRTGKDSPGREFRKNFLGFSMRMIRESLLHVEHAGELARLSGSTDLLGGVPFENAAEIVSILDKSVYYIERNANPRILFLDVSLSLHKLLNANPAF